MNTKKNAIMYGAGNIGRGFIGPLFAKSGYQVTFIDVAPETVNALNRDGRYPVRVLSNDCHTDNWVEGVCAVNGQDAETAARCIAEADIMATAVGVRVLPFIAPVIAMGLKIRFQNTRTPLNIIICENLMDANHVLGKLIKENLNEEEWEIFDERIGLVEASIGRMVPIQTKEMQDGNPLRICTEAYGFLPVDKNAFIGKIPLINGMVPFGKFDFFIQRKLFIHNMGHAVCAYLGILLGDQYIYETINRGEILFIVQNAMIESALALSAKFDMPLEDMIFHIKDLLYRFSNKSLADTCARVGGDVVRKLGTSDRLIGAMRCCGEAGITPVFISIGSAAALHCYLKEKGFTQTLETAANALVEISSLQKESPEAKLILSIYSKLLNGVDLFELRKVAMLDGNKPGVI